MTAYFDKIGGWLRAAESGLGADPESVLASERVALVDRVERAVTWDLMCVMHVSGFPEDLAWDAARLIDRYPLAPEGILCHESDVRGRWFLQNDLFEREWERDRLDCVESVGEGMLFTARFVSEVHSLMHDVAGRMVDAPWGSSFSDSLDQNMSEMDSWLSDAIGREGYDLIPHRLIWQSSMRGQVIANAGNWRKGSALVKLGIDRCPR